MDVSLASATDSMGATRAANVEEVFTTLSKWKAYGGPASLARVHMTPRSAKACLREGIDPEVRPPRCVCGRCSFMCVRAYLLVLPV